MSSIKHESNIGHTWRVSRRGVLCAGEAAAFSILRDQHSLFNEPFEGFTFTRFDGSTITV